MEYFTGVVDEWDQYYKFTFVRNKFSQLVSLWNYDSTNNKNFRWSKMPLTDYKILLLNVNRTGWHSGNMVYDMEVIKQAADTTFYGPGWDNYQHTDIRHIIDQVYKDELPDMIYTYFTPNEPVGNVYIEQYNIPQNLRMFPTGMQELWTDQTYSKVKTAFAVSDFWSRRPEQWSADLQGSQFQYCFSCFVPPLSRGKDFFRFLNPDVMGNPVYVALARCVDKNCFKDYGLSKEEDIITLGSMYKFYGFRRWMHAALAMHCPSKGIRYKNYPHCGTEWRHSGFVRDEYAKAINRAHAMASCGGKFHLYYNKIFESWGCNTAYIGERPYGEAELHMQDGVNYVAVNQSNFLDKVDHYMSNKDELSDISENGRQTFLQYHTLETRAQSLANTLQEIMEGA